MDKEYMDLMLKSQPESPSLHFKLGMWFRSRGQIKEAAQSLEKALQYARYPANDDSYSDLFDEPQVWLEYGKTMRMDGHIQQAEASFQQCLRLGKYEQESMVEWGSMMYELGMPDKVISSTFLSVHPTAVSNLIIAQTLCILGSYEEALLLYKSMTLSTEVVSDHLLSYISCLIQTNDYEGAISLLHTLSSESQHQLFRIGQQRMMLSETFYVCTWCLSNGQGIAPLSCYDAIETAKTAIALGKVEAAMTMMDRPTPQERNELIHTLYLHGYLEHATSLLSELMELPLYDRNQTSLEICFIAAEIQYDLGEYQKAATIFESIFATDPTHTPSRFAAASCYLQQSIASFTEKLELEIIGSDDYFKIQQYLTNMTHSFQILQSAKWHTEWTPAQRRNQSLPPQPVYH